MKLIKDKVLPQVANSEIISIAYDPIKQFIATCAYEEPVVIRKYPYIVKVLRKIIHRTKLPVETEESSYSLDDKSIDHELLQIPASKNSNDASHAENSQSYAGTDKEKGPIVTPNKAIFFGEGKFIAIAYRNGILRVYNTTTWVKTAEINVSFEINSMQLMADGKTLFIMTAANSIHFIEIDSWKTTQTLQIDIPNPGVGVLSNKNRFLYLIADKKRVICIDLNSMEQKFVLKGHKTGINAIHLSPDESIIATSGNDGKIALFNAETGEQIAFLLGHMDEIHAFIFTPNGELLISSSEDESIRVWDLKTHKCVKKFEEVPNSFEMILDGEMLIAGNVNGELRIYKLFL